MAFKFEKMLSCCLYSTLINCLRIRKTFFCFLYEDLSTFKYNKYNKLSLILEAKTFIKRTIKEKSDKINVKIRLMIIYYFYILIELLMLMRLENALDNNITVFVFLV